ncbi:hypothetical protein ACLHIM_03590 [Ligilactobacillus sp. LYQ112]|uniref:hypothetical protein n=1 Tax=Ligilactobacillus sp. LYQ112 TaxID=3391060 RepID=UPI003983D8CF
MRLLNKQLVVVLCGLGVLGSGVPAVQAAPSNQQLNLPLNQVGQNHQRQQTRNENTQLFQTDRVGDLAQTRHQLLRQGRRTVFTKNGRLPNPVNQANLFRRPGKKTTAPHYAPTSNQVTITHRGQLPWLWLVAGGVVCGAAGISGHMIWREQREQHSRN